jgi:hypothetical protein
MRWESKFAPWVLLHSRHVSVTILPPSSEGMMCSSVSCGGSESIAASGKGRKHRGQRIDSGKWEVTLAKSVFRSVNNRSTLCLAMSNRILPQTSMHEKHSCPSGLRSRKKRRHDVARRPQDRRGREAPQRVALLGKQGSERAWHAHPHRGLIRALPRAGERVI